MAMNHEQFVALVQRLDAGASQRPAAYRQRVVLLAALGYLYVLLLLLLALTLSIGIIVLFVTQKISGGYALFKIEFILVGFTVLVLRSLWVTFSVPDGIELQRAEVPALFQMVDELRAQLQSGPLHHLILASDFNAGILQRPRLGILGWQENYMLIGLPLMAALTPEQLRAVLAHELGHLSGNHSRFAGWIYRVRRTWSQILQNFQRQGNRGAVFFEVFLRWYAPFFSAYSFVLARQDEYVADRCAGEAAGLEPAAAALMRIEVKGRFLQEQFWPDIYKLAETQAVPDSTPYATMLPGLRALPEPATAATWLQEALREQTGYSDTHPALTDRLSALGYKFDSEPGVPLLAAPATTAAEALLGESLPRLVKALDAAWKAAVTPQWQQRYQYAGAAREKLTALEAKAEREPLTAEEAWDRIQWTWDLRGDATALPLLRVFLNAQPEHSAANFVLGQILLEAGDAAGIACVEKSMAQESDSIIPGCEIIYRFLKRQGREEEATRYRIRAVERIELLEQAEQEWNKFTPKDKLLPPALDEAALTSLREQLAHYPEVRAAYVVRKEIPGLPEKPRYILVIARHSPWYKPEAEDRPARLLRQLQAELTLLPSMGIYVLSRQARDNSLEKAVRRVAGTELYNAKTAKTGRRA